MVPRCLWGCSDGLAIMSGKSVGGRRAALFLVRVPLLVLALLAASGAAWFTAQLLGDARMHATSGIVTESGSVPWGQPVGLPDRPGIGPCRDGGSPAWAMFSDGWFIVEHPRGAVAFCSGTREVGTDIDLWVNPSDPTDGRLFPPGFTVPEAITGVVVMVVLAFLLVWSWLRVRL